MGDKINVKSGETKNEEVVKRPFIITPPYDPRFPNTNQTRRCYQNYVDYQKCSRKKGKEYDVCQYFKFVYTSLCPLDWVERWDRQIAEGVFAEKID